MKQHTPFTGHFNIQITEPVIYPYADRLLVPISRYNVLVVVDFELLFIKSKCILTICKLCKQKKHAKNDKTQKDPL